MSAFQTITKTLLVLFLYIAVGILCKKIHLIDKAGQKLLSNLVLDVFLPCNIVISFLNDSSLSGGARSLVLDSLLVGSAIQAGAILLNRILFRKEPPSKKSAMSFGILCSNSSFIGVPMAEALFGAPGVVIISLFMLPIRLTNWTIGLHYYDSSSKDASVKKALLKPPVIAVLAGVLFMALHVTLPNFLYTPMKGLGNCCTPLSMVVMGAILADSKWSDLITKDTLRFSAIRLGLMPALMFLVTLAVPMDSVLKNVAILSCALPMGCTASMLAEKYGYDSLYASQLIFATTVISVITLPLWALLF